jgi:phosphatidate cytidylyltransferase
MLRWRITLGVLFSVLLAGLCWLDAQASTPGVWLLPLALLIAFLATDELSRMLAARTPSALGAMVYLGNVAIVAANWAPQLLPKFALEAWTWPALALAGSMIAALVVEVVRYREPARQTERLALEALGLVYIGLLLSFAVQMRFAGPHGDWGLAAIASLILVVKLCDIGAYTVGRLIGRHKLAPRLSPGKTIEGGFGGLAFAIFGAWLSLTVLWPAMSHVSPPEVAAWQWLGFGLTVGVAGMIGDLAESLLKRDLGRKDSSDWMPGFGGVLDLLDSILVGAPIAYFWWHYLL